MLQRTLAKWAISRIVSKVGNVVGNLTVIKSYNNFRKCSLYHSFVCVVFLQCLLKAYITAFDIFNSTGYNNILYYQSRILAICRRTRCVFSENKRKNLVKTISHETWFSRTLLVLCAITTLEDSCYVFHISTDSRVACVKVYVYKYTGSPKAPSSYIRNASESLKTVSMCLINSWRVSFG